MQVIAENDKEIDCLYESYDTRTLIYGTILVPVCLHIYKHFEQHSNYYNKTNLGWLNRANPRFGLIKHKISNIMSWHIK